MYIGVQERIHSFLNVWNLPAGYRKLTMHEKSMVKMNNDNSYFN